MNCEKKNLIKIFYSNYKLNKYLPFNYRIENKLNILVK